MAYKVVINISVGNFLLSAKAEKLFWERKLGKEIFVYKYNSENDNYIKVSDLTRTSEWNVHFTVEDYGKIADNIDELIFGRIKRHDPVLVQVVEELGSEANVEASNLKVIEIPCPMYKIIDCYGKESIKTPVSEDWITIEEDEHDN